MAAAQKTLSVRGSVVDPAGAAVAGASVWVETPNGAVVARTQTDAKGYFALPNLTSGTFSVVVPAYSGFAQRVAPLRLTVDVTGLSLKLASEIVKQSVTIDSDQALSTDSSANRDSVTVSGDALRKVPAFDLDYVNSLSSFLDASSGSSGGVTLIVDGIEMKSAGVSPSAIQEVRINNDPYSAEFSRPGRGRIEITTKPGSPQYHGEFNFLIRDAIFNAKNYFAVTRPPETRRLFEGHFTGPVGRDKRTNFIASGEFGQRNTAAIVDAIELGGPVNLSVATPQTNSQASLRVTHDFSSAHRLQVGYNYEADSSNNSGVGGIVLPEAGTNNSSREDDLIFNDRIIVSPSLINQLLVTFEKDEDVTNSVTNARAIQVNGFFVGGGAQADSSRTENTIHVNEVVTWSHGRHYIRFGVQLPQFSRRAVDDHTNRLGTLLYSSLANYPANLATSLGTPYAYTAQQGIGRGLYWANETGTFFQDQIKLNPRLQVTLGLRYDWVTYLSDNNNFSPRFSLAYAPGKGRTVLRLGSGVFYDRTGGDFPATFKLHNGLVLDSVLLQNPTSQQLASGTFSAVPSNVVREEHNLRAPYTIQSSFGIERQLNKKLTITAAYRNSVQVKSFRSRDANAPILPTNPILSSDYPRPNPAFGQIQQIESGGRMYLNGLDLSLRGPVGRWFSGQIQYTLARSETNVGGISRFPQDQYHPNAEWGRANSDRLHTFNVIGNIYPDHWLSLGVNASLLSGLPYTETTGTDDFHTGLGNARPLAVGRNTLQSKGSVGLDLQWEHEFNLTKAKDEDAKVISTGVSAFNVLNHTNYSGYIGSLASTRFMQPTSAQAGRQIQFAIGYRF
ncbi:MAG: TonB-dependent receptor [Acidobacteriota bacterium]|nr:TonB-dependent receptor [Acidobacteriota bacterium]